MKYGPGKNTSDADQVQHKGTNQQIQIVVLLFHFSIRGFGRRKPSTQGVGK